MKVNGSEVSGHGRRAEILKVETGGNTESFRKVEFVRLGISGMGPVRRGWSCPEGGGLGSSVRATGFILFFGANRLMPYREPIIALCNIRGYLYMGGGLLIPVLRV